MTDSSTIHLHIAKAVPQGNVKETQNIVQLWQSIAGYFQQRDFQAQANPGADRHHYQLSLDVSPLLQRMEYAQGSYESFDDYLKVHGQDQEKRVDGDLSLTVVSQSRGHDELEAYQVATLFLQQLFLAATIAVPGSIRLLDTRFTGREGHRFDAQCFDSDIFSGARQFAQHNDWPPLASLAFAEVWTWLEALETATVHTAIKGINKVLFSLLKLAQQRHEFGARTVLLLTYQLEVLLNCRNAMSDQPLRKHLQMILGRIPEDSEGLEELYQVKLGLFEGDQPVVRPALASYGLAKRPRGQIGQHQGAVEQGVAAVLALLQDLVRHQAQGFEFQESLSRKAL